MSKLKIDDIVDFLESFEVLVSKNDIKNGIVNDNELYYIYYCKAKAEAFLMEMDEEDIKREDIDVYKENLRIVIDTIDALTKLIDSNKIVKSKKADDKVMYSKYTVRDAKNRIFALPFKISDIDWELIQRGITTMVYLLCSVVGAICALREYKTNIPKCLAILAVSYIICVISCYIIGYIVEFFRYKILYGVSKEDRETFCSTIINKIIWITRKDEYKVSYRHIMSYIRDTKDIKDVNYIVAKVEVIGEYVNRQYINSDKINSQRENIVNNTIDTLLTDLNNKVGK